MTEKIVLESRSLCKSFRTGSALVRAVVDVSLTIREGSYCVITGPSGSGKTTLLSLLGALDRPSSGELFFHGSPLHGFSDAALARLRRKMGFVFQNFSLIAGLPVWENVTYPLVPRGVRARERWQLARQCLARMGLEEKLERRPEELSGGEQQRIAVARALAGQPEILFADEPISNLDPANSLAVMLLLEEFHKSGRTVILSVHNVNLVPPFAAIIELENGKLNTS